MATSQNEMMRQFILVENYQSISGGRRSLSAGRRLICLLNYATNVGLVFLLCLQCISEYTSKT